MKFYCILNSLFAVLALAVLTEQNDLFDNGFSAKKIEARLAGSEEVDTITEYPFQVQVLSHREFCSGAIISESFILTAAQCVGEGSDEEGIKNLEVRAGNVVRGAGTVLPIEDVVHHPLFESSSQRFEYNIAYMKTVSLIVFSEKIQPGLLVERFVAENVSVTGWGKQQVYTMQQRALSVLREVQLQLIDDRKCEEEYRGEYKIDSDIVFCGYEPDAGACGKEDIGDPASIEPKVILGLVCETNRYCQFAGYEIQPTIFTALGRDEIRKFITNGTGVEYVTYEDLQDSQ